MDRRPTYNEHALALRLKAGDHSAFNQLYDLFGPALYTLIIEIVEDRQKADDITLCVFRSIWLQKSTFNPERSRLFTWMMRIAHDHALKEARRDQQLTKINIDDPRAEVTLGADKLLIPLGLKQALQLLPVESRRLLDCLYYQGLTIQQLANSRTVSETVMKSKVGSALILLGNVLRKKSGW